MVTTVEPGIYLPASSKVPARFRDIGIRIEDDVLVTANGPDVLSKGLVKEPDAIESLMAA
jgi:Xaa-Pro aminopeptidase